MEKKRSERMQIIVDLALVAESQAARNLSEAQNELAFERQRLEDIKNYYQSYQKQFDKTTQRMSAQDLSNSRAFLSNLDHARQVQCTQIMHSEQKVDLAREQWRNSHLKSDAMASFQSHAADTEQKHEDKVEQKLIDDLSCQRHSRS